MHQRGNRVENNAERVEPLIVQRQREHIPNNRGATVVIPQIGDTVQIINPRRGQEASSIVEGYCRNGKVKVLTQTGNQITRLPKNIQIIAHER